MNETLLTLLSLAAASVLFGAWAAIDGLARVHESQENLLAQPDAPRLDLELAVGGAVAALASAAALVVYGVRRLGTAMRDADEADKGTGACR